MKANKANKHTLICDVEIGRPGGLWHSCKKPATLEIMGRFSKVFHLCKRHEATATDPKHFSQPIQVLRKIK